MEKLIRTIDFTGRSVEEIRLNLRREWLVTNGLGGYASGTISGSVTRRYHGLLIAALPAPLGRVVMLNHLTECVRLDQEKLLQFGGDEPRHTEASPTLGHSLVSFRLENLVPIWRYEMHGVILEKRLVMLHGQNTVHITYTLLSHQEQVQLSLRPSVHFRDHDQRVSQVLEDDYLFSIYGERYEISDRLDHKPPLRLWLHGHRPEFIHDGAAQAEILYPIEADRGYESRGVLWTPGYFTVWVRPKTPATLVASTEPWHTILALSPEESFEYDQERKQRLLIRAAAPARAGMGAELVLAADQFIITPAGRVQDAARARAHGDEVRTVIAGYHWFTDWGRDTMISLEGLTLTTGRFNEAVWILRTFAHYIRDGLIPNLFPEGKHEGLYHTADATLWFFHALDRYVEITKDRTVIPQMLPKLTAIIEHHLQGTHFGIKVDPQDGLLAQGAPGYQLTWMDAKVDDWVVTPRRGKAVEINALWYNALCLAEHWLRTQDQVPLADTLAQHAEKAKAAFNQRFWYEAGAYLYDVVDGEHGKDMACRPNQLLAISLKYPILDQSRWLRVLKVVQEKLLTPVGLRSLSPGHPDYKSKYFGDLRARDDAYHQGTVWGWLIGPFIDAWLKVHPGQKAEARQFLEGYMPYMSEACIGSVSEIFDAESPFTPRGCIAQAWSVAELLRCWAKTAPE